MKVSATFLSFLSTAGVLSTVGALRVSALTSHGVSLPKQQSTQREPRRWVPTAMAAMQPTEEVDSRGDMQGASMNRREAMLTSGAQFSVALSLLLGASTAAPDAAQAMSVDKFLQQMRVFGIKDTKPCPDGYSPVLEFYGKARQSTPGAANTDPLLITYNSPNGWVTVRPNIDNNGEDGTVSSGDYGKGDSASLFVYPKEIDVEDKDALFDAVYAGVTQKGASQVQGFKMKKAKTLAASTESTYVTFEYSYTLLTGAGFEIDRKGIGSIVSVKGSRSTQMMLGACTDIRFKKVEGDLREVADSFRVYSGVIPPS